MARSKRGGYRPPASPAPVSGPGALSARTDGGPGQRQPVRVAPGGPYGQRQALETQQQAAPLAVANPISCGGGGVTPSAPPAAGVFGPTQRPGEPISTGLGGGMIVPEDPDVLLRALWQVYPHPDIARLIG